MDSYALIYQNDCEESDSNFPNKLFTDNSCLPHGHWNAAERKLRCEQTISELVISQEDENCVCSCL